MTQPGIKARLTSEYDYLDDIGGVIELEIVPERIISVPEVIEVTTLEDVWDMVG